MSEGSGLLKHNGDFVCDGIDSGMQDDFNSNLNCDSKSGTHPRPIQKSLGTQRVNSKLLCSEHYLHSPVCAIGV